MAVFSEPVVLANKLPDPLARLLLPETFEARLLEPTEVLALPLLFNKSA